MDDILIRSKARKEHAEYIEKVFERIKDFGSKCEFSMTSIKYLGQIIDANDYRRGNERYFALKNMPLLTTL